MNKRTFSIAGAVGAACVLASAPALADEFRCTGAVGPVQLDNIFVPDGARCTLDRTRAKGSIVVGRGATLMANSVSVNGNLQAEGAGEVQVVGFSTFGGSVQIVKSGLTVVNRARVNGDILFDENVGTVSADRNNIGGNLQAFKNMAGTTLTGNRMKGNLQCKENVPAPTGSGNVATSKEDQCARL